MGGDEPGEWERKDEDGRGEVKGGGPKGVSGRRVFYSPSPSSDLEPSEEPDWESWCWWWWW